LRALAPVLCALSLASCAAAPEAPRSYTLAIDPALSADVQGAVRDAAGAWLAALPALSLTFADACPAQGAAICVTSGTIGGYALGHCDMQQPAHVTLDLAYIAERGAVTQWVATHELGHGMGLIHDEPGTVMAADYPDQTPGPTARDAERWGER
jgi:hypothetical protein